MIPTSDPTAGLPRYATLEYRQALTYALALALHLIPADRRQAFLDDLYRRWTQVWSRPAEPTCEDPS